MINKVDEFVGIILPKTRRFPIRHGGTPNSSKSFDHDLDGEEILRDSHRGLSENGLDTLIPSINCHFNGNHVD